MKNHILIIVTVAILGGSVAYYFQWQHSQIKPEPEQAQAPHHPLPEPKPELHQIIDASPISQALPALANSDNFILDALSGLVGNKSLMELFHTERIIRNIVVTIDNLPRRNASMRMMPFEQAPGRFITEGAANDLVISPKNAVRYTPYVKIADAVDTRKLVEMYVHLYPLFQEAYEELGYPKKYFNDRLIEALDNLLDTPDSKEPIRLIQPHVLYLFADPELEGRSIGQRILIRIGSKNGAIIKAKLHEMKQELILHMRERKVESAV